jgi:hypothetical protein
LLEPLREPVIDAVAEHAYRAASPRSYAAMFHMGGAVARTRQDATAYAARDVDHNIVIDAAWLPSRTRPSGGRRPPGHEHSSTPCSPTGPASM